MPDEGFVASRYADKVDRPSEAELDRQARKAGGMPPQRRGEQHPADPARLQAAERRRIARDTQRHEDKPKPEPEPEAKPTTRARARTKARAAASTADRGLTAAAGHTRRAGGRAFTLSGLPAAGRNTSRNLLWAAGWVVGLSILYLLLTNAQNSGRGRSAVELLLGSISTGVNTLINPAADPLNPSVLTGTKALTPASASALTQAANAGAKTVSSVAELAAHPAAVATAAPNQAGHAGATLAADLSNPLLAAAGAISAGRTYLRPPRRRSHP